MNKYQAMYQNMAVGMGLCYDEANNTIHGIFRNFNVVIYALDARYPYNMTVEAGAINGMQLSKEDIKAFVKSSGFIKSFKQEGRRVSGTFMVNRKKEQTLPSLAAALNGFADYLISRGFVPCCENCGKQVPTVGYIVGGKHAVLCDECGQAISRTMAGNAAIEDTKVENVPAGIIGAILGSLLGLLSIILISRLGYISFISGLIMGICTVKGYELLAKKLSKKGVIISIIVMCIMTYVADRADWAIEVLAAFRDEYNITFFEAFRAVPSLISERVIEMSSYIGNLVLLYIAILAGGIPTAIAVMGSKKIKNSIVRLSIPGMAAQPMGVPVQPAEMPVQSTEMPVNQAGINSDLLK